MRSYRRMISVIRRQLPLALAVVVTATVVLAFGHRTGGPVLAWTNGDITGTAFIYGLAGTPPESPNCSFSGAVLLTPVLKRIDNIDRIQGMGTVTGSGECNSLTFALTGTIDGEEKEKFDSIPNVVEVPVNGSYTLQFQLQGDIGSLKTIDPLLITCTDIFDRSQQECTGPGPVILYDDTSKTPGPSKTPIPLLVMSGISLKYSAGVGGIAEIPDVEGISPQLDDSSATSAGVLAGIAAGAAAGVVVLGGGAWYARRTWLRRPR